MDSTFLCRLHCRALAWILSTDSLSFSYMHCRSWSVTSFAWTLLLASLPVLLSTLHAFPHCTYSKFLLLPTASHTHRLALLFTFYILHFSIAMALLGHFPAFSVFLHAARSTIEQRRNQAHIAEFQIPDHLHMRLGFWGMLCREKGETRDDTCFMMNFRWWRFGGGGVGEYMMT